MTDRPTDGSEATLLEEPAAPPPTGPWAGAGLCPFLVAAEGDWRAASPSRDHRCSAVEPPAILSPDKQRRLCLLPDHVDCATFVAARAYLGAAGMRLDGDGVEDDGDGGDDAGERSGPARPFVRWPIPRTAPVVVDRGRPSVRDVLADRSVTQLALVLLMILAFVVLALARISGGSNGAVGAQQTPSPSVVAATSTASVEPSAEASAPAAIGSPSLAPTATLSPVPSPTPIPSGPASPSPGPSAARTYRVVPGDTLTGIAARFGVSLAALEAANQLTDPSHLRVGTVLIIP